MITSQYTKDSARVRIFTFLCLFNPGAIHTYRDIVLALTSNGARVTTNALSVVYYEAVFHGRNIW